jgi:hypothetical protein
MLEETLLGYALKSLHTKKDSCQPTQTKRAAQSYFVQLSSHLLSRNFRDADILSTFQAGESTGRA